MSLLVVAVVAVTVTAERATTPAPALRYRDVQPIFERHCAACHDVRKSKNPRAQAVFEMSRGYPFATQRPDSLLDDLRHMFETRGSLSADEKLRGLAWLRGGALDADGKRPVWR